MKTPIDLYIEKVRLLLPCMRKEEKAYLEKLRRSMEESIDPDNETTLSKLEEEFGAAEHVVEQYISSLDTDALVHQLEIRRILKRCGIVLLMIVILAGTYYVINQTRTEQVFEEEAVFFDQRVK